MQAPETATTAPAQLPAFRPCTSPAPVVLAFYERLRRLPLGAWVEIGEALDAKADESTPDGGIALASARAQLRRVVDGSPRLAARHHRRVQQVVTEADGVVHRSVSASMKKAALSAALALVVRPMLAEDVFARLYAPFSDLIPLDELSAPQGTAAPADLWRPENAFESGDAMC